MSILDRITARAAGRPAEPSTVTRAEVVTAEEFGRLMASESGAFSAAGLTVTRDVALKVSAYYSGVRYLAETVAGLPAPVFRTLPGDGREKRALPSWREKPHPSVSWYSFVEALTAQVVTRGNGFAVKDRHPDTYQLDGMIPVDSSNVRFGLDRSTGLKWFEVRDASGSWVAMSEREVLHVPGFTLDGFFGLDPLKYHATSLGIGRAGDLYADAFYTGTGLSHGYISLPGKLNDDEIERVKRQWERFHRGVTKAHDFGVLGDGASYQTFGLDAEKAQLLATREFTVVEIARALRIPPHKLYDLSHATFSNIEHQSIEAVVDSIRPWCVRLEAAFRNDLDLFPSGNFLEFNLDGLLRGDTISRYTAYGIGIDKGFLMPSEPRRRENFEHVDGLDYFLVPLNMRQVGPDAPPEGDTEATLAEKTNAAGTLVRSGWDPDDALRVTGLPPMKHTGRAPVTLQSEDA